MKKYNQEEKRLLLFDFDVRDKNVQILKTLEEDAEQIFDNHLNSRKQWYPHEMIPWNRYSNIEEYGFDYNKEKISENISSALYLLLMTEDNLPWYTRSFTRIIDTRDRPTIWNDWLQQWTAEEDNHSYVIRNYMTLNGLMDPFYLEDGRMRQISNGFVVEFELVSELLTYTVLQELAGRIIYRKVANALEDDSDGYRIMSKIASDENRHFLFYRDVSKKGFEKHPSEFLIGLSIKGIDFKLPADHWPAGQSLTDFDKHSKNMANAGFWNFDIYINEVLKPNLDFWKIDELEGLTPEAEKARDDIFLYVDKSNKFIERIKDKALRSNSRSEFSELNKITHLPSLFKDN